MLWGSPSTNVNFLPSDKSELEIYLTACDNGPSAIIEDFYYWSLKERYNYDFS